MSHEHQLRCAGVRNQFSRLPASSRESNHAYLVVEGEDTAADVFARYLTNDWIDLPAHQRAQELWAPAAREPDLRSPAAIRGDDFSIEL